MADLKEVEIGGVVTIIADGGIRSVEWVSYKGRAWLTPLWLPSRDGKWIRPVRLIAAQMVPGHKAPPGPEWLTPLSDLQLPASLLDEITPPKATPRLVEVIETPPIMSRNPKSGH